MRNLARSLSAAILGLALAADVAVGQEPPIAAVYEKQFETTAPPGPVEVIQTIVDFPAGTGSAPHTHGGELFVSSLEGALMVNEGGSERAFVAGESLVETPGVVYAAANAAAGPGRLLVTFVLPKGAPPTTVREGISPQAVPPGPTTTALRRADLGNLPAQLDVVHRVTDIAPNTVIPRHSHPGPNLVTVLEGELSVTMAGMQHSYKAGESWLEPAEEVHGVSTGPDKARVATTTLVARGAPISAAADQPAATAPAAPAAQAPGRLPRTGDLPSAVLPTMLAGFALLTGGALARRLHR